MISKAAVDELVARVEELHTVLTRDALRLKWAAQSLGAGGKAYLALNAAINQLRESSRVLEDTAASLLFFREGDIEPGQVVAVKAKVFQTREMN